jgi:WD40 repeat protein
MRKELRRFGKVEGATGPLAFSPDGKLLATGKAPPIFPVPTAGARAQAGPVNPEAVGPLLLWEVATGKLRVEGRGPRSNLRSAVFSPDGKRIFGPVDHQMYAWEVKTGGVIALHALYGVTDVAVLPGRSPLALAAGQEAVLWDLERQQPRARLRGHRGLLGRVALSADGRLLATGGSDGTVLVWDLRKLPGVRPGR